MDKKSFKNTKSVKNFAFLSMYVGVEDYDVSQFAIYHSDDDGLTLDTTSVSNVSYDGEYLSFEVSGFSTYGYTVISASTAVPEPSTYAMIGIFYNIETSVKGLSVNPLAMLNIVSLNTDSATCSNELLLTSNYT